MYTFQLVCFQVAEWFAKLFPEVSLPSERIPPLITRKQNKFTKLPPAQQLAFLHESLDFENASPALTELGLKRRELLAEKKEVNLPDGFFCTNQVVVDLVSFKSTEPLVKGCCKFLPEWLDLLCPGLSLKDATSIASKYTKMAKTKSLRDDLNIFLASRAQTNKTSTPSHPTNTPKAIVPSPTDLKLQNEKN